MCIQRYGNHVSDTNPIQNTFEPSSYQYIYLDACIILVMQLDSFNNTVWSIYIAWQQ